MQKQKEADYQKVISIEEYLNKRKMIREQNKGRRTVPNWDYPGYQAHLCLDQSLF